jgi:hypothetical protein
MTALERIEAELEKAVELGVNPPCKQGNELDKMKALQHVAQENRSSGCGVACIAMLARTTYEHTRNTIFPEQENDLYIGDWPDMRTYLRKMGVSHAPKALRAPIWENFNCFAIVWCMSDAEERGSPVGHRGKVGHYVVYDPQKKWIYDLLKERAVPCSQIRRHPISYLKCCPVNAS